MNMDNIRDIVFPPLCLGCSKNIGSGVVCGECLAGIKLFETLFCGTCAARLPELKKICHNDAPYILVAAGDYDNNILQALIHGLKFQGIKGVAYPLADLLA